MDRKSGKRDQTLFTTDQAKGQTPQSWSQKQSIAYPFYFSLTAISLQLERSYYHQLLLDQLISLERTKRHKHQETSRVLQRAPHSLGKQQQ